MESRPAAERTRRHALNAIADRPRRDAALAVAAAWLAFMAAIVAGGEAGDAASFALAGAAGAALVFVGFLAVSRARPLPRHSNADRARLAALSLATGVALGAANLAANWLIAAASPTLRTLLTGRMETLPPLVAVVASPIMEEVALRLFLMSVLAWAVSRVTKRTGVALTIALVGSALFFAALHLARPMPDDPTLANLYRAALLAKYTLAGVPLGWIFWRCGLPYAILCHVAANAAHLALQEGLF